MEEVNVLLDERSTSALSLVIRPNRPICILIHIQLITSPFRSRNNTFPQRKVTQRKRLEFFLDSQTVNSGQKIIATMLRELGDLPMMLSIHRLEASPNHQLDECI
jgi:hypothetical protein